MIGLLGVLQNSIQDNGSTGEEIALSCMYCAHFIILVTGASVRVCQYGDVGLYSLNVSRPTRYWVKVGLHAAMWLVLLGELVICIVLR